METDEDLADRSRHDPAAFEPLVDRHAAALHGYLTRRCGPAADDLLSEVWLAAYARRADYDRALGSVRSWLFGIARNHVLAHWRRAASAARASGHGNGADEHDWSAVDARLDAASLLPALRAALNELTADERELLLLIAWEQLTPSEAAQVTGIPPGTARSRLHRARTRMRGLLGAHSGAAPGVPPLTNPTVSANGGSA
ncbi:RNA polymerase sigma factor [Streptomyces brasiliensis]|uniref:DNA-directed RNA polymerase sigma-70 factor n=1 Tax=Streptomyces brasiliensis TaxID=1954 RepID=A0A917KZC2_9ACTN|nr:sigma-70 family RNA polymerase sigma factor [Streptomyces brasiliensis]GGJ37216.1 DNA-directed RNA polymerase sigma-70 factor [Streptomyces brasiliensis]